MGPSQSHREQRARSDSDDVRAVVPALAAAQSLHETLGGPTQDAPRRTGACLCDFVRCLDQASDALAASSDFSSTLRDGTAGEVISAEAAEKMKQERETRMQDFAERLVPVLFANDVPTRLIACVESLDFEAQKDATRAFDAILRLAALAPASGAEEKLAKYVQSSGLSWRLLEEYGRTHVFMHHAEMLRSCARLPGLVAAILREGVANRLVELAQHQLLDISFEAFSCLGKLLFVQKSVVGAYLVTHLEAFFGQYHKLLEEEGYVTRRQALRLLSTLLMDPSFADVAAAYVGADFLPIIMNLMRDDSLSIQLEAFKVFKLFVMSPCMPRRAELILSRNSKGLRRLLCALYDDFKKDDMSEEDFVLVQDLRAVAQALLELAEGERASMATTLGSRPPRMLASSAPCLPAGLAVKA